MHSLRIFATAVFTALSITAIAAIGAQAQTPPVTSPTEPTTVLHANTNLVLVDVVVTDHDKPVHTLDRNRFHLFEDGHEQTITSFDEHHSATTAPGAMPPMKRAMLPPAPIPTSPNIRSPGR